MKSLWILRLPMTLASSADAGDFLDFVHRAGQSCNEASPVHIRISAAAECAAVGFGKLIQLLCYFIRGIPGIQRFFTGSDGIDAVFRA